MKTIGLDSIKRLAKQITSEAACVCDYRLSRKADREMRGIARTLTEGGRGYIIATAKELEEKHPGLFKARTTDTCRFIWAVRYEACNVGRKVEFCPLG